MARGDQLARQWIMKVDPLFHRQEKGSALDSYHNSYNIFFYRVKCCFTARYADLTC